MSCVSYSNLIQSNYDKLSESEQEGLTIFVVPTEKT